MFLTLLSKCRNFLYRLIFSYNKFKVFGRLAIISLICLTLYSWLGVYRILKNDQRPTTQSSILFQRAYLPIGGANLQFDQPWKLTKKSILNKFSDLETGDRFILSDLAYSPGLGNLMFEYAALHYFAEKHNATIIIPSNCLLLRAFGQLKRSKIMDYKVLTAYLLYLEEKQVDFHESKICCDFLPDMSLFKNRSIEVVKGYFQTYRYSRPKFEKEIRESFTFLPGVLQRANSIINTLKHQWNVVQNESLSQEPVFIGVHIRHGMDVTMHSRNKYHGHVSAPIEYFSKAIQKMRSMLPDKKLIFLVASDDIKWAQDSLKPFELFVGEFQFINSGYREVDMAALTLCNNTILSTGSFSWWIAFLANGTSLYYGGWPKPGTVLHIMVERSSYFPDDWISIL